MLLDLILFLAGFYILVKGADFLIDGSSSLARGIGMSNFLIGLVIVGIGTSIPEFAITFLSNLAEETPVGLGTVIGSNTFNILFILGFSALFLPLEFKREWVTRDLLWNIAAVAVAILAVLFFETWKVGRIEGAVLLIFFFAWLYLSIKKPSAADTDKPLRVFAFPLALIMIFAGFAGVIFGAKWVIDGAEVIANSLGVNEAIVGLTLVGIGTSLPELVVTFRAALRGQPGLAVGNIIGSNIFDFLMILGASAAASPIIFPPPLITDAVITMFAAILLYVFMFWGKSLVLERWQGALMVTLYGAYFIYIAGRAFFG